ncbi:MAG TPA: AIM24 family protein, partial [Actinoplanes sp.]|nr:AIM24 family protein [Actinoplanes sp.]
AERPFNITRGCWIANSHGVQIQTQWAGAQSLFGGEGGFVIQAAGQGDVVLGAYGAVDTIELAPGEAVTVDSGHLVAYDASVQSRLRRAVEGRSVQSMKSGEGLVFDFAGPGRLLIQTRNPRALLDWLTAELPFSRS